MIPPGLLFALGLLSGGATFSQNGHLQRKATAEYSRELCLQCPSLTTRHIPPRTAVRFDLGSYGDLALPWDPVHVKVHVCLLRMGSPFPPVLWSSCTQAPLAFNARSSRSSFYHCQIPTGESFMWGSELSLL